MGSRSRISVLGCLVATALAGTAALATSAQAAPQHFVNTSNVLVPGDSPATLYPSPISVSGLTGTVSKATATIAGVGGELDELQVLLVGPAGQATVLMRFACSNDLSGGGESFTFDDSAASQLSTTTCNTSGSFKTSDFDLSPVPFSPPAPQALPYGTALASYNGTNPNGTWSLFVENEGGAGASNLTAGWSLDIETNPVAAPAKKKKKCKKRKKKGKAGAAAKKKKCKKKKKKK